MKRNEFGLGICKLLLCSLLLASVVVTGGLGAGKAYADTITKLVLSTNTATLAVGDSQSITATAIYESGATSDATVKTDWNSGDPSIATVYNGNIVGVAPGTVVITATYGGQTVVVNATVTKKVQSITKNKQKVDIRVGETSQINLTATYADNTTEVINDKATWKIDDDSVATVASGLITGVSSGTATITATYGKQTVSITVNVDVARRLDPDQAAVTLRVGGTQQLKLMAMFDDGSLVDVADAAEWSTDQDTVADAYKGLITAYGSGEATITAKYGTKTATITVDVDVAKLLTASATEVFLKEGDQQQIKITATYGDGTAEDVTSKVKWASADESVAYVANGQIYASSIGQTTITGSYGSKTVSISVDVGVPRLLTASGTSFSMRTGATQPVAITATYVDGSTETIAADKIEWTSDTDDVAYAKSGQIYALAQGTAILTASYGGKQISIQVAVDTTRSLTVSDTSLSLKTGDTKQLTLTSTYTDGTTKDVTKEAEWSVDPSGVATVYQGAVTAIGPGQATVTANYGSETVTITVGVDLVKQLVFDKTDLFLKAGGTEQLTLTASYDDGTTQDVTQKAAWSSDNENVAYVTKGKVTAAATGQVTVTASYGGKTSTMTVDVAVARKLQFTPSDLSLRSGSSGKLAVTATYADGSTEDVTSKATWSSSDENVAHVSSGMVNAYTAGETTVTAQYGAKTATLTVEVDDTSSLTADTAKLTMQPDQSSQVKLTAVYAGGSETSDVTALAEWSSKDSGIATVKSGLITGVARGATTVTAKYGTRTVTITVSVGEMTQLTVSSKTLALSDEQTSQLSAVVTFKDGTTKDVTGDAVWTSSDAKVAKVTGGLVSAIGSGTATVTAAYGDQTATVSVEVEIAKTLSASKHTVILKKNDTYQLLVTMANSSGVIEDVTSKATWTSGTASVADVGSTGLVTAYAQGRATITAKYGGKTVSIPVEVDVAQKLVVSKKSLQLKSGDTETLTVTATFSDGSTRDVTVDSDWSTSSYKVADVDAGGTVTATDTGKATIYAKFGGKSASVAVEVNKLKYLQTDIHRVVMKAGDSKTITLTATYADGTDAVVNEPALWKSSNVAVADVKDGVITAEYKGTTTVTGKYAGKSVAVTVIVQ